MTDLRSISIGDLFDRQASATPDRLYFAHHTRNQEYTYGEFKQLIDAAAKGLMAIGVSKGDHVVTTGGIRGVGHRTAPNHAAAQTALGVLSKRLKDNQKRWN